MHVVDKAFQLCAALCVGLIALVAIVRYRWYGRRAMSRVPKRDAAGREFSGPGLVILAAALKLIGFVVPLARHASDWLLVPILIAGFMRWRQSRRRRPAESAYTRSLRRSTRQR